MRIKFWLSLGLIILLLGIFLRNGRAGLIDYERINRIKYGRPEGAQSSTAKGGSPNESDDFPQWLKVEPKVTNDIERQYDVNDDGKLQSAEMKVFLREVLDQIDKKGGYTVNSDALKEYDKNKDGLISRLEADAIKAYVR